MFGKIVKIFLGIMMVAIVSACEKPDDRRESIIEANLIRSFQDEKPEVQQKITKIISKVKAHKYQNALNELALLSSSRILTKRQEFEVISFMRILRYNMEERIFSEQARQTHKKPQE